MSFKTPTPIQWTDETAAIVKKVYLRRLRSVYQVSYNKKDNEEEFDRDRDKMMDYFIDLYGPKTVPILNPPQSSKRLFGSKRPERFYTQLSDYQDSIGRTAYNIFRIDYDKGISRLHRKRTVPGL